MRLRSFSALVAIVAAVAALTLPVTAPALAAPVLHIGIAYDTGGVGDHSINDAAAAAVIAVQKKFSVMVDATVTIGTDADRESRIRALVAKGCDPVVVVGSGYATTIKKVSLDFPTTNLPYLMMQAWIHSMLQPLSFQKVRGDILRE